MLISDLEAALDRLGWTKKDLSERIGVHQTTISRWGYVPGPVEAYLDVMVKLKGILDV